MRTKFEKVSLVVIGAVLGVTLSLNYPAIADKDVKPQLPLDELRTFAEVYGKIADMMHLVELINKKSKVSQVTFEEIVNDYTFKFNQTEEE